jgi:hypothetical protein
MNPNEPLHDESNAAQFRAAFLRWMAAVHWPFIARGKAFGAIRTSLSEC